MVQRARLAGANMIIGVDINESKKEMTERFGMTHFVILEKLEKTWFLTLSTY